MAQSASPRTLLLSLPSNLLQQVVKRAGHSASGNLRTICKQLREAVDSSRTKLAVRSEQCAAVASAAARFPMVKQLDLTCLQTDDNVASTAEQQQSLSHNLLALVQAASQHWPVLAALSFGDVTPANVQRLANLGVALHGHLTQVALGRGSEASVSAHALQLLSMFAPALEDLHWHSGFPSDDSAFTAVAKLRALRNLKIGSIGITGASVSLLPLAAPAPTLTSLSLVSSSDSLTTLPAVRALNLMGSDASFGTGMSQFMQSLGSNLKALKFRNQKHDVPACDGEFVRSLVHAMPQLSTLYLPTGASITDAAMAHIATHAKNLRILLVSGAPNVTPMGVFAGLTSTSIHIAQLSRCPQATEASCAHIQSMRASLKEECKAQMVFE